MQSLPRQQQNNAPCANWACPFTYAWRHFYWVSLIAADTDDSLNLLCVCRTVRHVNRQPCPSAQSARRRSTSVSVKCTISNLEWKPFIAVALSLNDGVYHLMMSSSSYYRVSPDQLPPVTLSRLSQSAATV